MSTSPAAPPPLYVPREQYKAPPVERWVWIGSIVGILVLAAISVPLVRMFMARTHEGQAVADVLHKQMRAHDLAGIYDDSDPSYKDEVGRQRSDDLFNRIHDRMGDPRDSKTIGETTSQTSNYGELLALRFRTKFDKGMATEVVTLHQIDGRYRMIGYHVYSPLLNTPKTEPPKSH